MRTPFLKSDPYIEWLYRLAGYTAAADAVADCRTQGDVACDALVTETEAYSAYEKKQAGGVADFLRAGLPAFSQWGETPLQSPVPKKPRHLRLVGPNEAPQPPNVPPPVTLLPVVGMAIYAGLAVADAVHYAHFQEQLSAGGKIVLPDPAHVCMMMCHAEGVKQRLAGPTPVIASKPSPFTEKAHGNRDAQLSAGERLILLRYVTLSWTQPSNTTKSPTIGPSETAITESSPDASAAGEPLADSTAKNLPCAEHVANVMLAAAQAVLGKPPSEKTAEGLREMARQICAEAKPRRWWRRAWESVTSPISRVRKFIQTRWYLRWAPVPLAAGYGLLRTHLIASEEEQTRAALVIPVPDDVRGRVKAGQVTLEEGIRIAHNYPYDRDLMGVLIRRLFAQVVTPEGILVVSHALLETFSLHPALDIETKLIYASPIMEAAGRAMLGFGKWVATLGLTGAMEAEEQVIEFGDPPQPFEGHPAPPSIKDFLEELRTEKSRLTVMMQAHIQWVDSHVTDPASLAIVHKRLEWFDRTFSLRWGSVHEKLLNLELYVEKGRAFLFSMREDFEAKNQGVWDRFETAMASPLSAGGLIGFFGGSLLLKPSWTMIFKNIPFMIAGTMAKASHDVEEQARTRLPIKLCMPSLGVACEPL